MFLKNQLLKIYLPVLGRRNISQTIKKVTVIGGGLMGSGIAQVVASKGFNVTLVEVNEKLEDKAMENINKNIRRVAKKKFNNEFYQKMLISDTMSNLRSSSNLKRAVEDVDLVIEAVVEDMKLKHELFSFIDSISPERTIFASNTSSLLISEMASSTKRQDRFGGLHFFNPVPVMRLVEVVKTDQQNEETHNKLVEFCHKLDKVPITCKDTSGFVVNRLLAPYLLEAIRLLERGDSSAKDIDIAMKLGAGYVIGPFELLDHIGLDTFNNVIKGWHEKYPDNPLFNPIPLLEKLVQENKLGSKTGEGFYTYKK